MFYERILVISKQVKDNRTIYNSITVSLKTEYVYCQMCYTCQVDTNKTRIAYVDESRSMQKQVCEQKKIYLHILPIIIP